ncbi:MAG: DNA-directed RNA polymerase subunit K [Candidatus Njordarchaeia archaeon]
MNNDDNKKNEEDLLGPPRLTIYEIARVIGTRAAQIAYGAPVLIPVHPKHGKRINEYEIAKIELKTGVLPLTIQRWLSTGKYQNIPVYKLKIDENV